MIEDGPDERYFVWDSIEVRYEVDGNRYCAMDRIALIPLGILRLIEGPGWVFHIFAGMSYMTPYELVSIGTLGNELNKLLDE